MGFRALPSDDEPPQQGEAYAPQTTPPPEELDDADLFKTNRNADRHTIVDMSLRSVRFVVITTIALVAAFTYATATNNKMELKMMHRGSKNPAVFTKEVESQVSDYNALFGTIMFAGSKIFEVYCETLIFPTLHTYLHNCSLYPGDQPQRVHSKVKANAIFWGLKAVLIFMNVGFASLYVGQSSNASEVTRRLSSMEDMEPLRMHTVSHGWETLDSLHNTILHTAVTGSTTPFTFADACHSEGTSSLSVLDVDTTSVEVGVPTHEWSGGVLPHGATPKLHLQVGVDEFSKHALLYEEQLKAHKYDVATVMELFTQGATVLSLSLGQQPPLQSQLPDSWQGVMNVVARAMNATLPIEVNKLNIGLEIYELAEDIMLTSMTVDVPVHPAAASATVCGAGGSCVFSHPVDSQLKREISIMPYTKDCESSSKCRAEDNTAFLYGLGTFVASAGSSATPTTHLTLSFGKLVWRESPLHVRHQAECVEGHCLGLSVPLASMNGVVLVGSEAIPRDHLEATLAAPLRLVALRPASFKEKSGDSFYSTWDRIVGNAASSNHTTAFVETQQFSGCHALVDSYLQHIESNRFYLEKPVQAMYTSALLYLLQNGVPTPYADATSRRLALAASSGAGKIEIVLGIPLSSSLATFIGCAVMLLLTVFVIFFPTERVKLSPNTTPAARYVQILTDDLYPDIVHKKRLRFINGDALLFNEYVVDSIVLYAKRKEQKKIYL
uniref:Uncharacterized protein n=1 Tax=Globisporangium ultimum (strain ATCC 200006 / CBS 805.95 / DAOM BR144) TaxID=431595 RepID=K3X962_GLOUD